MKQLNKKNYFAFFFSFVAQIIAQYRSNEHATVLRFEMPNKTNAEMDMDKTKEHI